MHYQPQAKNLIQLALALNREALLNLRNRKQDELCAQFKPIVNGVYEYAMTNPMQGIGTAKGTVCGAYNAITGYFQNVRFYRDDEAKAKSILYGGTAQLRSQEALDLCYSFAGNGTDTLQLNQYHFKKDVFS